MGSELGIVERWMLTLSMSDVKMFSRRIRPIILEGDFQNWLDTDLREKKRK